jgi:hypothetical protein
MRSILFTIVYISGKIVVVSDIKVLYLKCS